jgi:hypothetical protein
MTFKNANKILTNQEIIDLIPDREFTQADACLWMGHRVQDEILSKLRCSEKKILGVLLEVQDLCIGQITMGYGLDAEYIGAKITECTGMTVEELKDYIDEAS